MSTTRQPQASVLASGDSDGEEVFWQPGRRVVHDRLRAENRNFHQNDSPEEETRSNGKKKKKKKEEKKKKKKKKEEKKGKKRGKKR